PPQVPMRVTLTEDKHRQFTGSVGYGSEEQARVAASWAHVNFLGDARRLGIRGKSSAVGRGRIGGAGEGRRVVGASELSRRRAAARHPGQILVARSRRAPRVQGTALLHSRFGVLGPGAGMGSEGTRVA